MRGTSGMEECEVFVLNWVINWVSAAGGRRGGAGKAWMAPMKVRRRMKIGLYMMDIILEEGKIERLTTWVHARWGFFSLEAARMG